MASEIRVNKIENRSGLGTVTFADTGVDLAGIVTATTFSGSGASLTDLPAASLTGTVADARLTTVSSSKLSGALPALDGSALTGVASTDNIRTNTDATFLKGVNVSGVATVGSAVTISESGIEATGVGITVANINGGQIGGRKNIIINGDMKIAQRTTTAQNAPTSGPHYKTIDRWLTWANAADKFSTQQVADAPSDFKYSLKVTSLGANANESYQTIGQRIESQNLTQLNLGTANAKPFTISFWVKSSLTGTFTGYIHGATSFQPSIVWTYTITDADTWEHKKVNIPAVTIGSGKFGSGGAELGMEIGFTLSGYGYKTANANTWVNETYKLAVTGLSSVDVTGTSGATFYVTGVQLEAGTQATPYEHRDYGDELALCQRYFYMHALTANHASSAPADSSPVGLAVKYNQNSFMGAVFFPVQMRNTPSFLKHTGTDHLILLKEGGNDSFNDIAVQDMGVNSAIVNFYDGVNTSSAAGWVQMENGYDGYIGFTAEI